MAASPTGRSRSPPGEQRPLSGGAAADEDDDERSLLATSSSSACAEPFGVTFSGRVERAPLDGPEERAKPTWNSGEERLRWRVGTPLAGVAAAAAASAGGAMVPPPLALLVSARVLNSRFRRTGVLACCSHWYESGDELSAYKK